MAAITTRPAAVQLAAGRNEDSGWQRGRLGPGSHAVAVGITCRDRGGSRSVNDSACGER